MLHNLSFIEDPTRILRAIRYESRYGLRMDGHTFNLARTCCAMDLVGDLSSARLRDELVACSTRRTSTSPCGASRSSASAVDPRPPARGRAHPRRWCSAATTCAPATGSRRKCRAGGCASSGCCATSSPRRSPRGPSACASRRRTPTCWRARSSSAGASPTASGAGPSEAELYDVADGEPLEALVAAMALDESGRRRRRLGALLDVTRHVRLEIRGDDLLALGFPSAPRMGEVLRSVLHLKLNGVVAGREEELEAAARMRL